MAMKSFHKKLILITGASSGIGEAFAEKLAEEGADLILTARNETKLLTMAQNLQDRHHIQVHVIAGDLSEPSFPGAIYAFTQKKGLSPDILINNAGFGKWNSFEHESYDTYQQMLNLNINAVVGLTRLYIPDMLKKGEGGVINIGSTASFQPVPHIAVYSATKAFVLSFSEALYGEYQGRGITVLALCPGNTISGFQETAHANVKGLRVDSVERVVEKGLKAFAKNKNYVIVGTDNYISALLTRIAPRKLVLKVAGNMIRKRINP